MQQPFRKSWKNWQNWSISRTRMHRSVLKQTLMAILSAFTSRSPLMLVRALERALAVERARTLLTALRAKETVLESPRMAKTRRMVLVIRKTILKRMVRIIPRTRLRLSAKPLVMQNVAEKREILPKTPRMQTTMALVPLLVTRLLMVLPLRLMQSTKL